MIETDNQSPVAAFYDSLSDDYDLMTDFRARLISEEPAFRKLLSNHRIARALDAGAGTGLHSLILARLGVQVTAVDISGAMLSRLVRNAGMLDVHVDTIESTLEDLPVDVPGTMDAVFCLGNTIAHVHRDDLAHVLDNFSRFLRPGGLLILQVPNYEKILHDAQRLQNIKERNGTIFIRYYDFEPEFVRFNVLTVKQRQGYSVQSVNLHPLMRSDLLRVLPIAGFNQPDFFTGISLQDFKPTESTDLVVLTTKTAGDAS
jgi:SAM-dependent methyltransferase